MTGTWNLFVTTPGGTSAANTPDYFSYDPVPDVTTVSPNSGPRTGGTAITITGSGFVTGATVKVGQGFYPAMPATNVVVVSSTKITADTGGGARAGTWNLSVATPGGTSAAHSSDDFSY